MGQALGVYDSWTIINENTAIKKCDKTFFEHRETGIPKGIKSFFNIESIRHGEQIYITLRFQENDYTGRIKAVQNDNSRLYWHCDLGNKFKPYNNKDQFPSIRFLRLNNKLYEIGFINEEILEDEKDDPYTSIISDKEGKRKIIYSTKYERNPKLRKKAIELHGTQCMICGFDFEKNYGIAGKSFIEVHHIKPLSDIGCEVEVNAETDLVCVCANCHRIIHRRRDGIYTIDEVHKMIEENREY